MRELLWEIVVGFLFYNAGRIFLSIVTIGRFPPSDQTEEYEGLLKLVGFVVWIAIVLGFYFLRIK